MRKIMCPMKISWKSRRENKIKVSIQEISAKGIGVDTKQETALDIFPGMKYSANSEGIYRESQSNCMNLQQWKQKIFEQK